MHKPPFPRIGLRIVKSAIAVFLCFMLYLIRKDGIPFYSAIAAILCMQTDIPSAKKVALNRTIGTLIGGVFGMLILLLERACIPNIDWIRYGLLSLCIIPLLYLTVLLEKTSSSYITCVVFLSVTVSHGGDVNPYLFAVNRILDTLIGIGISMGVNAFPPLRRRAVKKSRAD